MGSDIKRGDWTDDRRDLAARMYKSGYSASQIRAELNKQRGVAPVSRNAVIGKLMRMGLTRADTPRRSTPQARRPPEPTKMRPSAHPRPLPLSRAAIAAAPPEEAELLEAAEAERELELARPLIGAITVLDLDSSRCKWPLDVPAGAFSFTFCGARPCDGTPYCDYHARLAYQSPVARRDQRPRPR